MWSPTLTQSLTEGVRTLLGNSLTESTIPLVAKMLGVENLTQSMRAVLTRWLRVEIV